MGLKPDEITPDWSIWDYGSHWLVNNDAWGVEIPITKRKDAHLIAAAPKLLGAIKDFLAVLEGEVLARGYGMADSIEEAHPAELRALEAAIAKAEGE